MKTLSLEEVKQVIRDDIAREDIGIIRHEAIARAIKANEGKPITKRIEKAIKAELRNDTVFVMYCMEYGLRKIKIGNLNGECGTDYTDHLIGYDSTPVFKLGTGSEQHCGFEYWDTCHGDAAEERNKKRLAMLTDPKVYRKCAALINAYVEAKEALEDRDGAMGLENESKYSLLRAAGIKD